MQAPAEVGLVLLPLTLYVGSYVGSDVRSNVGSDVGSDGEWVSVYVSTCA